MEKEIVKIKKMSALLKYIELRAKTLGCIIDFYYDKVRDGGYMTSGDECSYHMACAQLKELENLVRFIEGK